MNEQKIEVLCWMDSPTVATGFATVSRNLLTQLNKTGKYRFTVLGISHLGIPFDTDKYPYLKFPEHGGLYPAQDGGDVYGFRKILSMISAGKPDILFILNDPFVIGNIMPQLLAIRDQLPKKFSIVYYFPLDMKPKKAWVTETIAKVDFPITYTEFASSAVLEQEPSLTNLKVIPHGTDREQFKPIVGDARTFLKKSIFGPYSERFIILTVCRNQPRKDLNKTFEVFSKFHKRFPETYLYVLASMNDVGGNMQEIAEQHGLKYGDDWNCPPAQSYNPNQGMPIAMVHSLYAACDLLVSTSVGEGWGLPITEAMSCGIPVLVPRHTSLVEIVGENEERGWLVEAGHFGDTMTMGLNDNNIVRPMVNSENMLEKLTRIYRYRSQSEKKIKAALEWVPTWESTASDWEEIFEAAAELCDQRTEEAKKKPVVEAGQEGSEGTP